jgi:hypothetical protein
MPPTPGLRLEYRLVRTGVPAAETVALVVQPSRDAWANLAVHGSTTDGHAPAYVIMGQDETTWYPDARVHFGENAGDDPAPILGAVPWPRFLPSPDEAYRFETVGISAGVQPDDIDGSWSPHQAVGRMPEQHRSITGPNGLFTLAYRGAPGDTIRLFYGPVTGQGYNARITDPLEITGRIRSPDFATLIYERP